MAVSHVAANGEPVAAVLSTAALDAYKGTLRSETVLMLDRYVLRDVAFKIVGVGSVGTFCAIGLMTTADGEQIVLQLKQARDPVILGLASSAPPASHAGKRVVDGQRAIQTSSAARPIGAPARSWRATRRADRIASSPPSNMMRAASHRPGAIAGDEASALLAFCRA